MIRLKNVHILILVFAVAAFFTLFQVLFMRNFQNFFKSNSMIDSKFVWINNMKELGLRITTMAKTLKLNSAIHEKNNNVWLKINNHQRDVTIKKHKKSEILISFKPNGQPHLIDMLPFYHKNNHFNFSSVYVYDYELEKIYSQRSGQKEPNRFVINEEHGRVQNIEQPLNIKGIDIRKANLYKPDENGQFKCLNSNVIFET
jgi:hypothetical protein